MASGTHSRPRKSPKNFWGSNPLRKAHQPLPRSLRYNVEALEPRYLLDGVALTNVNNDGSKPPVAAYVAAVSATVQNVIGQLSYLGQQVDKTSLTDSTATTKIPLLNQTPEQLANLATTGSGFGTQAGNITFGSILLNETDSNGNNLFAKDINTFLSNSTNADNLTSTSLAAELQREGQQLFGSNFTVVDNGSTTSQLDLKVSFTADTSHSVALDVGQSAGEYNLLLASEATGSPDAQVDTKLSGTYDIKLNLATFDSAYNAGGSTAQTQENNSFTVATTSTSFQQSAVVVSSDPLPTFGIEFGVMGAGSPGILENGVSMTQGSNTLNLGSSAGLTTGMSIMGTGIADGTTISAINGNQITLSQAITHNESGEQVTIGAVNGAYVNSSGFVEGSVALSTSSNFVTLSSTTGLQLHEIVQGVGIPENTTISSINGNVIGLSSTPTINGYSTLTINATAALKLNEEMVFQLTDATLAYSNIAAETYAFSAPATLAANVTASNIGISAVNTDELSTGVIGVEDISTLPGYVGNLNLTGSFTLYSDYLFDGHPALVFPDSPELANFARISNADIVVDAQNADSLITELGNSSSLQSNVPFTSESLSGAYDFGTAAEIGFVNALQNTTEVLVGSSSPGTYNTTTGSYDSTNLSGSASFTLEVVLSAGIIGTYTVNVPTGGTGRTLQGLANDLQTALKTATIQDIVESSVALTSGSNTVTLASVGGLAVGMNVQGTGIAAGTTISSINSSTGVVTLSRAATATGTGIALSMTSTTTVTQDLTEIFTAQVSGTTLQLVSGVSGIQFFLSDFSSDASSPAAGTLNLGFNSYGSVALYGNGDIDTTADYQLPGVVLTSSSAINLSDFQTATQFTFTINNGTDSTYGSMPITVSLAAGSYTQTTLVAALTTALQQAVLNDGFDTNGVMVRSFTLANGVDFGLQFYGGDDVYQMSIQNSGSTSAASKFQLTTTTVTAPYFYLSINGGTATKVYLNGNFTTGLLDNLAPAASLNDLVSDIQLGLVASGALAADQSSGITVTSTPSATGNVLVFSAVNAGTGAGQISTFSISSPSSGLSSLNLVGSSANSSMHWAMAQSVTAPAFVTIQDLENLLIQKGVMQAGTFGDYDAVDGTFTFPLNFTVTSSSSSTAAFPDLSVPLSFADTYDSVSNLQSSSTVGVNRSDTIKFDFGFNITPQTGAAEVLYADLPVVIPFWDTAGNQVLQSNSPLLFQISTDDGVVHTIQLNQLVQSDGTSKFYTTDSSKASDFITAFNGALTAAGLQITAVFSPEDSLGRSQIVLTTAAGAYRELVVTVPATSSGLVSVADSAWTYLGFGTGQTGTSYTATSTGNQITSAGPLQFLLSNSNNTIPTDGDFYVTLPDGTVSGFTLNPANLPANASTTDVINELNYEIASTTSLLGSSYGAIGTSTVKMTLSSGSTTATIDASSTIDPTPYVDANNNVGAGYGLMPGMTLTGTGLAANTIIQSVTYDPVSKTVKLTLSQAATSTTNKGSVTVQASSSAAEYNILPKIIASAQVNGSVTNIVFTLNPQVFGPNVQSWSLQVASTYFQQLDNPASLELGLPSSTVTDSQVPATGIVSTAITGNTFTNWAAGTPASFQVSLNGSSYVTVTVNKSDLNGNDTIAGLIAALNTAFANTTINLSIPGSDPGAANSNTYHLNQFLQADAIDGGTNVLIRLVNSTDTTLPVLSGARISLVSGANVMNNAGVLGFFSASGPTEYIFGQRGGEAVVSAPELSGVLTITDAAFTATAQFGFVNFNIASGSLNETTSLTFSSSDNAATLLDLEQAVTDANDSSSTLYNSYGITIEPATSAEAVLKGLSFPNSTGITNLNFDSTGAEIDITYPEASASGSTGHYITDFSNLPPAEVSYIHTNGMELLSTLGFSDIADGLMRVGDLLSDWMTTNLNDPYSSSLLYSKLSLQEVDDLGADFKALIQQIESQPPGSLQTAAQVLANGLQMPLGSIQFSITNTTTENSSGQLGNGGQLALQISFDWVKSLTQTLPLSVDLATMYDKASANNGTGQTPQDDLLGLTSIAGSGVDPLNVILTEVSSLNVNLSLLVAQAASASVLPTTMTPEAIINNPTSGNFFETRFFLTGDNLSGQLPAGVDYLQLTNGSVAIDATGQTDIPFASQSSTGLLILTNSTGANTSSQVSGQVSYDAAGDKGILIQGVTTLPFSVPVVNGLITGSGLFSLNGITPVVGSQILVNTADDYTILADTSYSSTNPGQNLVLNNVAASVFANLAIGQGISGSFLPTGTTITGFNATNRTITVSQGISGTGSQTQGVFFIAQNAGAVNGLYTVTQNDATHGYILTLSQSIASLNASNSPDQRFVVTSASGNSQANQVFDSSTAVHYAAVTTSPNNLDAYGTPFTYDLAAASSFAAPTVVNVLAASTSSVSTFSGTGTSIVIGGATLSTNGQVILNHQATLSQNGLYNLTFSGGHWTLTEVSTPGNLSSTTRYHVQNGTYGGMTMGTYGASQFAVMLQPASYSYNLQTINGSASEVLPYTVDAATDAALSSLATYTNGVFTSTAQINLNAQTFTESDGSIVTGIDGVTDLGVGSLVLVKNETGANAYENGVYEITSVGQSGTSNWTMQRADFALTPSQMANIRIAVDQGHTNADTRWVQNAADVAVAAANANVFSSGVDVTFSNQLGLVYKNGSTAWLVTSINGGASANLPLQLVQVNDDGSETLINRDLGDVNADAKTALGGDGASLINDPLYLYYQSLVNGSYVIQPTPVFTSLNIVIPSLNNFYTSASGGTLFFNPATGYNPTNTNTQNNPPALVDSATSANVLTQLQNGFYLGDALDLALFSIQSAMDEAMGIDFPLLGTNLNLYTSYVEQIRAKLTNNIRNMILANPLTPVDDVRDALYATLGSNPGGLGYLTDESQITVNLYSGATSTAFDFNRGDLVNYVQTPLGLKNTVAGSVTAITFGIELTGTKGGAGYQDDKIDSIDLGDSSIGAVISTDTVSSTGAATHGGVDLQTYFDFNFGFGVSTSSGFFIFNPTSTSATPAPMIDLNFTAQLTGDVSAAGVTPFVQTNYTSTLQNLTVNVADGRATTDTVADGGDGYASGFFGDVIFNLDNHITGGSDPLGRSTVATGEDVYATVDDLREATELGPNVTTAANKPSGLLNFTINADADIDLLIESQQAGLIPAIETDLVEAKRYGTGADASFKLDFNNAALVGLGNQVLGQTVLNDFAAYYDITQPNDDSAAYNTLTADQQAQVDSDYENASPIWRFNRSDLTSNGQAGNTFIAYQNLAIDVYDYLSGPFFKSLINLENVIAPIRPVLDFLTTPVPGTSWMGSPLVLINLFPSTLSPKSTSPTEKSNAGKGAQAASVAASMQLIIETLHSVDSMLGPLAALAATASASAPWQHPQASLGGSASFSTKPLQVNGATDQTNAQNVKLYKQAVAESNASYNSAQQAAENLSNLAELPFYEPPDEETSAEDNQSALSKALSALNETLTTPTKYSETFNALQTGEFFDATTGNALTKMVKGSLNEQAVKNNKSGGQYAINIGLSGGAFYLDAFSANSILEVLNGETANLLQVQLPTITATFAYMKTFPLPAFPPLELRIGITFTLSISINLGYDTNGFYWNTLDLSTNKPAPFFSIAVQFSVGVGLDFGLVNVSLDLFFKLTVGFLWNDISGTGELHQSDIDYLVDHGQSLFAVELTGQIGFHFEIDLTIPLLFTSITIPIFQYTFTLTIFDFLLGSYTGHIDLGSVTNGVLLLNMGPYAGNRNFVNVSDRNETFYVYGYNQGASASTIEQNGETVIVEFDSGTTIYYQEFTGVKQVVGYAGVGDSAIYAGTSLTLSQATDLVDGGTIAANTTLTSLNYAVVDFFGGAGNVVLQAGTSYYSAWATASGRSRLVGGTGVSLLDGSESTKSLDLIAGVTSSTVEGSLAGGDNIVARQGSDLLYGNGPSDTFTFTNGFGHDRIYVTGNGNSVNFSGLTLNASPTDPSAVPTLIIAPVTTSIDFQFGQLVDSAVTANSTVFFAVDPSEKNSIDTWTGGTGGDLFTVFFFAPDQTLHLDETVNSGANSYDIYLGDPNIHYYVVGDSRNIGTIDIDDNSTIQGQVFLTQLFSNTITYNNSMVSNGREQMNFNPSLQVSLDAPDATLYWGDPNNPGAYTLQAGGNIDVGHLVLLGNVLLTSSAVIQLTHSFVLDYDIDVEGGTLTNPASIEFDLRTNNPSVDANFVLANNSVTSAPSRLMISTGTSQDGLGIGNIFLNLYTGSLLNQSGTTDYGILELGTGTLVILALETIGTLDSPIHVRVDNLTAKTTTTINQLFTYGIFLYSDQDLALTGYGSVSGNQNDNILGVTTVNGDIKVELAPTFTLTYYQIIAGGSGNVEIIADNISITTGFNVIENELQAVPHTVTIGYIYLVPEILFFSVDYFFFHLTYAEVFFLPVYFTYSYTYYTNEILPTAVKITAAGAKIQGTGNLSFENATPGEDIQVGGSVLLPSATGFLLSDSVLDSVVTGFASMTIGRSKPVNGSPSTGTVTLAEQESFNALSVLLQGTNLNIDYSVSVTNLLTFSAYNVASGSSINFSNSANTYEAATVNVSTDQTADLSLHGLFLSNAPGGAISIKTGGSLNLLGSLVANQGNASKIIVQAAGAIAINNQDGLLKPNSNTLYGSLSASAGAGDLLSEIDLTAGQSGLIGISQAANSTLVAPNMSFVALGSIALTAQMDTLLLASGSSLNLTNRTLSASIWSIDEVTASTGGISITDSGAGIQLVRTSAHALDDLISTAQGQGVNITAGGAFTGSSTGSLLDIATTNLTMNIAGGISGATSSTNLLIDVAQLNAVTTATGDVHISNVGGPIVLQQLITANGLISLQSNKDITVDTVQSQTSSASNSITLTTTLTQGGNINLGNVTGAITGVVDAGALGTVTLNADGLIAGALSVANAGDISKQLDLITGGSVSLTSNANAITGAGIAILARVKTGSLDAFTTNTGQIQIYALSPTATGNETSENLYLHDLKTTQGDITILGAAASQTNLPLNFITGDVNAQASNLTLETSGTITENTNPLTNADLQELLVFQLHAGLLTTQSTGTSYLDTAVVSLDAQVFGTGDLTVLARGTLDVYRATTVNGDIIINGDSSSVASIRVGTISAGSTSSTDGKSDVTITSNIEDILDLNATHNNVTLSQFNANVAAIGALTGLTAARFTSHTAFGIQGLTTQVDILDAYSTENISAEMILTQTGDITIDIVSMQEGNFALNADANITVNSLESDTISSQINLNTSGGWIKQIAGTSATMANIIGFGLTLQAVNGIVLNTEVTTLNATNSGGTDVSRADIVLSNLSTTELDVSLVAASHGSIDLTTAGDLVLENLPLNQSTYLSTPVKGASSLTPYHINLTAGGKIMGGANGANLFDVVTDDLTMSSGASISGLGTNDSLVTQISKLTAVTSGPGAIRISNRGDLELTNVETGNGLIFIQDDTNLIVDLVQTDTVTASDSVTLISTGGSIDQNAATGATTANVIGYALNLQAFSGILLNTEVTTLNAIDNGGTDLNRANIVLHNLLTTELDVSLVAASHGNIDLTTDGDLVLENLPQGQSTYLSTPTNGANSLTPYQVNLTAGGKIMGGTSGTGATALFDVVTDDLTMNSGTSLSGLGDNDSLVTEISKLTAVTSGPGAIRLTNRGALELVNVETQNGLIFIQNDAAMIVDTVTSDTSISANTIVLQNTLDLTSANITLGTINAGALADVTITSTGAILGGTNNLITGDTMTLTAEGLEGAANSAIDVNVFGSVLVANATGSGQILIHTTGDLTLNQVDTVSGDIHITATGTASLLYSEIEAGTGVNFSSDIYLTAAGTIGEYKPTPANSARAYKIIGNVLTVQSGGTTYLDTIIQTLNATVTGDGTLTEDQTGDLNVYNASTINGAITITAIPAGVQTGANIFIGTLSAGIAVLAESDVNLTANGGYIQDLDITTITDPAIIAPLNFAPLLSGDTFTATADQGIHGLHTAVTTFDATTTAQNAYILVSELNDINIDHVLMPYGDFTLTAGGTIDVNDLTANTDSSTVNLTSLNSRIQQEMGKINANILNAYAATGIQALTNIHDLTAKITGTAGDINILNDGSLTIEQVYTPLGAFVLNLTSGSLTPSLQTDPLASTPVYHVVANDITIHTTTGIGSPVDPTGYLSVYADEIDGATASISGGIYIHNYKTVHSNLYPNGFDLNEVLAKDGPISIISAGDMYARDVEINQDANLNDITLTTTDAGNILLNFVGTGLSDAIPGVTPPLNGLATFISAGNIEEVDTTLIPMLQVVNVVAANVKFDATTGIGSGDDGILMTARSLTANTVTGDIILGNSSTTDFSITNFTTGAGNLTFTQKGGGALHATGLVTEKGNIKLTVGNGAYLFLGTTFAIGNTSFVSDHINFQGGPDSIFGTGVLTINPDSPTQYVQLNSYFASTIYERADTLEISKSGFAAFFTDFQAILIGNQVSRQLTYMYYDVEAGDAAYLGILSEGYNMMSRIPSWSGNIDLFRVTDLFLPPNDLAVLQRSDSDQFNQILDTELNIGEDSGDSGMFDGSDSGDDFFAVAQPAPARAAQVAVHAGHDHNHALMARLTHESSTEHDAWIDQALITTAVALPAVASVKPRSWFARVFSSRNRKS